MDLDTSTSSISTDIPAQESIITEKPSEKPPEKVPVVSSDESSLGFHQISIPSEIYPTCNCWPSQITCTPLWP